MVKCLDCEQEMLDVRGCTLKYIEGLVSYGRMPMPNGGMQYVPELTHAEMHARLRYGEDGYTNEAEHTKCHDCGAERGRLHHFGCDMERCPKCRGQLISCSCFAQVNTRDGAPPSCIHDKQHPASEESPDIEVTGKKPHEVRVCKKCGAKRIGGKKWELI